MDTHTAAAGLKAVHDKVVGARTGCQRIGLNLGDVGLGRQGKGLVLGSIGLAILVPMEQREVDDPQEVVTLALDLERIGHVRTHAAQDLVGEQARASSEHHKVAGLDVHALAQSSHLLVREELDDGAVDRAVLAESNPGQALGAKRGGHAGKLIDLGTCPGTGALGVDGLDDRALLVCGSRKDLELGVGEDVGQVDQVHAIAGIGLVGAIGVHGLPVVHTTQRRRHLDAHAAEGVGQDLLERAHDVVLVHEGHLDIDLGELGLTVGTQVLVAEALGNLVVALNATDHEQLLQKLRGLRQGVEVARLDAAGNDEVAGALGRGLEQGGRLDLHELTVVQRLPNGKGKVGAQLEVGHHLGTTEVQIAIAQAGVLARLDAVLDLERRGDGRVEHLGVVGQDLDLAGRELGVGGLLTTSAHDAVDLDGPLGTHGLGDLKGIAVGVLGVEGELRDALAVTKVAEDKAAVVAATTHPTGEGDLFAHVLEAKLAAGTGVHGMLIDGTGLAHTSDPPLWICAAPCRSGRRRTDLPSLRKPRSQTWRSILSHLCRCAAEKWLLPKDLTETKQLMRRGTRLHASRATICPNKTALGKARHDCTAHCYGYRLHAHQPGGHRPVGRGGRRRRASGEDH